MSSMSQSDFDRQRKALRKQKIERLQNLRAQYDASGADPKLTDSERLGAGAGMLLDNITMGLGDEILGRTESLMGRGSYEDRKKAAKELRLRGKRQMPAWGDATTVAGIGTGAVAPARFVIPAALASAGKAANDEDVENLALAGSSMKFLGGAGKHMLKGPVDLVESSLRGGTGLLGASGGLGLSLIDELGEQNAELKMLEDWKRASTKARPAEKKSERAKIRSEILKAMGR